MGRCCSVLLVKVSAGLRAAALGQDKSSQAPETSRTYLRRSCLRSLGAEESTMRSAVTARREESDSDDDGDNSDDDDVVKKVCSV